MGLRPAMVMVPRKHWASSPRLTVSGSIPGASTVKWFCSIDGCPDGANVGVATQDRDEVGLTVPSRLQPLR